MTDGGAPPASVPTPAVRRVLLGRAQRPAGDGPQHSNASSTRCSTSETSGTGARAARSTPPRRSGSPMRARMCLPWRPADSDWSVRVDRIRPGVAGRGTAAQFARDVVRWLRLGTPRAQDAVAPAARMAGGGRQRQRAAAPVANAGGTGLGQGVNLRCDDSRLVPAGIWSSPAVVRRGCAVSIAAVGEPLAPASSPRWRATSGCSSAWPYGRAKPRLVVTTRLLIVSLPVTAPRSAPSSSRAPQRVPERRVAVHAMPPGTGALRGGRHHRGTCQPGGSRALGFFRTGVSAMEDDLGAAGLDAFGSPLFPAAPGGRASGAFKSPDLRNVELTGPVLHTGGSATLEQVMEFYARNGDAPAGGKSQARHREHPAESAGARPDRRVFEGVDRRSRAHERAPFDHPSLCVPCRVRARIQPASSRRIPRCRGRRRRRRICMGAGAGSRRAEEFSCRCRRSPELLQEHQARMDRGRTPSIAVRAMTVMPRSTAAAHASAKRGATGAAGLVLRSGSRLNSAHHAVIGNASTPPVSARARRRARPPWLAVASPPAHPLSRRGMSA